MGRGATKFITDQAVTGTGSHSAAGLPPPGPPPPQQPADYHFPFGNPALLISTLPSSKHLPLHQLYRPPAPPVPQISKPEGAAVGVEEEPESREVNEALRNPEEEGLPQTRDEVQVPTLAAEEQKIREADQRPRMINADRREAAVKQRTVFAAMEQAMRQANEQSRRQHALQKAAAAEEWAEEFEIPLEDRRLDRRRPDIALAQNPHARTAPTVAQDKARLYDQIHILGSNIRAKFLAHNLAGLPKAPPVQLLLNQKYDLDTWKEEGQAINLFRGSRGEHRNRIEAEWIFDRNPRRVQGGHINQLIVTVPCATTVRALSKIRDRVDHNTTICLIQEGLGVVEALNSKVFRDVETRPHYVLGHMTHILGYSKKGYTLSEMIPGQLALTAFDGLTGYDRIRSHPPIERQMREGYFLQLLTLNPDLRAGGFRYSNFLQRKFPDMIFRSAVDPVVAILGVTYDRVLSSPYAKNLFAQLLAEIGQVIVALPEARDAPALADYVESGTMLRHCKARLMKRARQPSPMAEQVGKGLETEIDYLNGYFVRRGSALGIQCLANDMVIGLLKAKQTLVRTELEKRLPYVGYGPPTGWKKGNDGIKKMTPIGRTRTET